MRNQHGPWLVALAATIWGTWSFYLRPAEAVAPISPFTETLMVQIAATLVALPIALMRRQKTPRPLRAWGFLALSGLSDTICGALFFLAMASTSLAVANLTHYLAPLFVALIAPLLERRAVSWSTVAAGLVALLGLTLMLEPWEGVPAHGYIGALAGAASALFYTAIVLLSKNVSPHFSAFELLAWQRLVPVVVLLPFMWQDALTLQSAQVWRLFAGGAVINGFAGMIFFAGLKRCRAEQASALTLLEPLTAVCVGWLIWHEPMRALGTAGIFLVLASLFAVLRQPQST